MAEYRPIKTKIWQDDWFLSLTPEQKAVWFFLLTNPHVHISGIYELPKTLVSPLVGSSKVDEILQKFESEGKIVYKSGWIFIKNYLKNQTKQINKIDSIKDNVVKSIIAYLTENPRIIKLFNLNNEDPYKPLLRPLKAPTKTLGESIKVLKSKDESIKDQNIKKSSTFNDDTNKQIVEILDLFKEINPIVKTMYGNTTQRKAIVDLIGLYGFDEVRRAAQYAVSIRGREYAPSITTPYELLQKYTKLEDYDKKNK